MIMISVLSSHIFFLSINACAHVSLWGGYWLVGAGYEHVSVHTAIHVSMCVFQHIVSSTEIIAKSSIGSLSCVSVVILLM